MNHHHRYISTSSSDNSSTSFGWKSTTIEPTKQKEQEKKDHNNSFLQAMSKEPVLKCAPIHLLMHHYDDPPTKEFRDYLKDTKMKSMAHNPAMIGEYLEYGYRNPGINLMFFNVLNFFPTFMEIALLLKEARSIVYSNNFFIIKTMSKADIDKFLVNNADSFVRYLSEDDIIELASCVGFNTRFNLKYMDKTEDICVMFE